MLSHSFSVRTTAGERQCLSVMLYCETDKFGDIFYKITAIPYYGGQQFMVDFGYDREEMLGKFNLLLKGQLDCQEADLRKFKE